MLSKAHRQFHLVYECDLNNMWIHVLLVICVQRPDRTLIDLTHEDHVRLKLVRLTLEWINNSVAYFQRRFIQRIYTDVNPAKLCSVKSLYALRYMNLDWMTAFFFVRLFSFCISLHVMTVVNRRCMGINGDIAMLISPEEIMSIYFQPDIRSTQLYVTYDQTNILVSQLCFTPSAAIVSWVKRIRFFLINSESGFNSYFFIVV